MGDIVKTIFTSVGDVIEGMMSAIKTAASNLIWVDPAAETKVMSDVFQFGLTFLGISLAFGLGMMVFRLIRR